MICPVAAFVRWLPLDSFARRAMDETLADWRHEIDEASNPTGRAAARFHGLAAVLIVIVRTTAVELRTPQAWVTAATIVMVAAGAAATYAVSFLHPAGATVWSYWTLLPQGMAATVPVVCAAPPMARGRRSLPFLGTAFLLTAALFVLNGWLTPAANQAFRRARFQSVTGQVSLDGPRRALTELTLGELADLAIGNGSDAARAARQMHLRIGLSLVAPAFIWLGIEVRRRIELTRRPRLGSAVSLLCALSVFVLGSLLSSLVTQLARSLGYQGPIGGALLGYLFVAVAVSEAAILAWLFARQGRLTNLPAAQQ